MLETLFARWKRGDVPTKNARRRRRAGEAARVPDRPPRRGAVDDLAGELVPAKAPDDDIAIETMNDVLGGAFSRAST